MNEAAAVGEETAGIADNDGWNPDLGDEVGGEQPGEGHGIDLVGLDPSGGDEFDQTWVGDDDLGDERGYLVVEIPGVGSGLDNQDIGGFEIDSSPLGPGGELDWTGREDGLELGIDAANDDVILVEIYSKETDAGWRKNGI
jgi:hypothetical protein